MNSSSTKVIEELQGEVMGTKAQLERTRNDLRLAQRLIGQVSPAGVGGFESMIPVILRVGCGCFASFAVDETE